MIVRSA